MIQIRWSSLKTNGRSQPLGRISSRLDRSTVCSSLCQLEVEVEVVCLFDLLGGSHFVARCRKAQIENLLKALFKVEIFFLHFLLAFLSLVLTAYLQLIFEQQLI